MSLTETPSQVQNIGQDRFYPSLTNPNWLVLRKRRELFKRWLGRLPQQNLSVLDVGGRIQPYRCLLGDRCNRYVAVDLRTTPLVNVIAKGQQLPFGDASFDLVFCTQVLEYVAEPQLVVNEIHRTLKDGGFLLLSVPAVFPRDSDIEYWRFLPSALEHLLAGFSHVDLASEGNSLTGLIRTLSVCLVTFARPPLLGKILSFTVVPVLNVLGAFLEVLIPVNDDRFTANFSALARK